MVEVPRPRTVQTLTIFLLVASAGLLVVLHFVPWLGFTMEGFGADVHGSAGPWDLHQRVGDDAHGQTSWFSADWENDDGELADGVAKIRAGAVLLVIATAATAAGAALFVLDRGIIASGTAAGAFVVTVTSTALVASGINEALNIHPYWHVGLYLAVLANIALFLGAALSFLPMPGLNVQDRLRAWSENDATATNGRPARASAQRRSLTKKRGPTKKKR
jgi:hypothetical protein